MKETDDWGVLRDAWHSQPVVCPDLEGLRIDAERRDRRARWMQGIEWVLAAVAAVMTTRFVLDDAVEVAAKILVLALLGIALAFGLWTLRTRRRLLRDTGLDAAALVEREIERAVAELRYWRINGFVMLAIWMALCAAALVPWLGDANAIDRRWLTAAAVNLPLVLASLAFERWRARRLHARIARLQELRRQLRDV